MSVDHDPDFLHPETIWNYLLAIVKEIGAIRWIEQVESQLLEGPHALKAQRMLDICAVKKMKLEADLGRLVTVTLNDPYWDGVIATLDRNKLTAKIRKYNGKKP